MKEITMKKLFLTIIFFSAIGCSQTRVENSTLAPINDYKPVGEQILLIADNQERLLTGRSLKSMSSLTEQFVTSVSLRSPLANVGGLSLFKLALADGLKNPTSAVIHLGDLADISCPDELTAVFDALDSSSDNWFIAPGNHDGLMAGTYSKFQPVFGYQGVGSIYHSPPNASLRGIERGWYNACLSPDNFADPSRADILTKGDSISHYVRRLKTRAGATVKSIPTESTKIARTNVNCTTEEISISKMNYRAVAKICPRTKVKGKDGWVGPYASYIVQSLQVGEVLMILVDTSNYINPSLKNVGLTGNLSEEQIKVIKKLVGEKSDSNVLVLGHHPLKDLNQSAKKFIDKISNRYVSAHTHTSAKIINHGELAELNMGSILDYPPQSVSLDVQGPEINFNVVGSTAGQTEVSGFLKVCVEHQNSWQLSYKVYTEYTYGTYVNQLIKSLSAASISAPVTAKVSVPDGSKIEDWGVLQSTLNTIDGMNGEGAEYWACQAFYASRATRNERGLAEKFIGIFSSSKGDEQNATLGWHKFP